MCEPACTWVDCDNAAQHDWKDKNDKVWTKLCDFHHERLDLSIKNAENEPAKMLSNYVKAQGGAALAVKRTMEMFE